MTKPTINDLLAKYAPEYADASVNEVAWCVVITDEKGRKVCHDSAKNALLASQVEPLVEALELCSDWSMRGAISASESEAGSGRYCFDSEAWGTALQNAREVLEVVK